MTPTDSTDPPQNAGSPIYLTTAQVARQLQVRRTQITKWVHGVRVAGKLVKLRADVIGDRFRITQGYVDSFLADCRAAKLGESSRPESPAQRDSRSQREKQQLIEACGG